MQANRFILITSTNSDVYIAITLFFREEFNEKLKKVKEEYKENFLSNKQDVKDVIKYK